MRIAAYKGISFLSKLIRFQTRSDVSHIGILDDDDRGVVYEAWQDGGVLCNANLSSRHTDGTEVDIYSLVHPFTRDEKTRVRVFLGSQLGKGYDFRSVFRFITRNNTPSDNTKLFCSEYAFMAFAAGGRELLCRAEPYRIPPCWIPMSPLLKYDQTVVTSKKDGKVPPMIRAPSPSPIIPAIPGVMPGGIDTGKKGDTAEIFKAVPRYEPKL